MTIIYRTDRSLDVIIERLEDYFWSNFRAMDYSDVIRSYFPGNGEIDHAWEATLERHYNATIILSSL
mgnify:CR=1 FL=1|jgi:hypothetical protein